VCWNNGRQRGGLEKQSITALGKDDQRNVRYPFLELVISIQYLAGMPEVDIRAIDRTGSLLRTGPSAWALLLQP
jgi:hypothetical protein